MRTLWLCLALVSCGPAVDSGSSGEDTAASTSGPEGDSATSLASASTLASTSSAMSSSSGASPSSSTGDPFEMEDALGLWVCSVDEESFTLAIDGYPAPQQLEGEVCASWNGETEPMQWGPCAELSSHPLGGGAELWIYATITEERGANWVVSAALLYDTETDSMTGVWSGTATPEDGAEVVCRRP